MKAKKGMISLVFILYLLNGNHIAAQSIPPDGLLSFDQATDIALRNSHSIKQAAFLKKENQEETRAAKGLRSPNIGLTAGYFLLSDDIHLDLTPVKNAITPLYSALSNYGNFSGVGSYPDAVSTQLVRGQLQQGLATIEKTSQYSCRY